MARQGGSISITTFDSSKILNNDKCTDLYQEVLEDIEGRIEEFNKQQNNGCEKWVKLNEDINNKEKELTKCYTQNLLTVHLNLSDKIRDFRDKYSKDPKCPNNPACCAEGPVKLQAKAEDSCGEKKNCREKTKPSERQSEPKAKGSKSQPGEGTKALETGTEEGQKLLQTDQDHTEGEEPTQKQLIRPVAHVPNSSYDSAHTHVETSQSRGNHPIGKPVQLETQEGSAPSLETPAGQIVTSSSENSPDGDSDPKASSEALGLSSRGHQGNSDDGVSSDSNLAGLQAYGKPAEGQTHGNKGDTTETSVDAPSSLKAPGHGVNVGGSHVHKHVSSEDVTHDVTHSSGEQALYVVTDDEGSSHTSAVREGNGDKAPACVTLSAKSTHSECTYDRNFNQLLTSNNASHYKIVVDDTFVGGDGSGFSGKDSRRDGENTHQPSAVTARTSIGGNSYDHIAILGEQGNKSFLPKAASVQSQEGKDTGNGTVHQDAQCPNENRLSQPGACPKPQLVHQEQVHEQQQGQEKGALPSSPGLTQQIPTYTVGNTYPQRSDKIPIYLTS
ncbi:hypothetical protein PVC01_060005000 [Plasmodium vivax]|uniref:VIR protein n=1 Tax=Plasmodium vivax TaxID=5855 RepID=A0A1G4H9D8_PLAVI|nr:hypothetical protein PVC01_060005000 [Plasmodium vivax]